MVSITSPEKALFCDYRDLLPEEKLTLRTKGFHHFLSPEGIRVVRELLDDIKARRGARGVVLLRLRFGFDPVTDEEKAKRSTWLRDSPCRSLQEVALHLGVSRERIRQIEAVTLRLLRHSRRRLKGYLATNE